MKNICTSLGDCGSSENYIREQGYYSDSDLLATEFWKSAKDFREEYS